MERPDPSADRCSFDAILPALPLPRDLHQATPELTALGPFGTFRRESDSLKRFNPPFVCRYNPNLDLETEEFGFARQKHTIKKIIIMNDSARQIR